MRKIITNLSGLIVALVCMTATLRAQEVKTVRMGEATVRELSLELRAAVPIDSSITYNLKGENVYKHVTMQDGTSMHEARYRWDRNRWVADESVPSVIFWTYTGVPEVKEEGGQLRFNIPQVDGWAHWSWTLGVVYETKSDSKGNLTEMTVSGRKFVIQYDALSRVISIENINGSGAIEDRFRYAYHGTGPWKTLFEHETYDAAKGKWVAGDLGRTVRQYKTIPLEGTTYTWDLRLLHEEWIADASGNWMGNKRYESVYDANGKETIMYHYVWYGNSWEQVMYTIYYPNALTPDVEPDNNDPVGSDNRGGFSLSTILVVDSVNSASFVVKMPAGFALDRENTALAAEWGDCELTVTPREDNEWLVIIRRKTTRAAALFADEASRALIHIAYTVNADVKRGTYDITVYNLLFETPGGASIAEPAITVPVNVNRWGMGNETATASAPTAYAHGGTLYIQSPRAEKVAIYAISGAKLYEGAIPAGTTTIAARLPKGVCIVAFGDGTRRKVWVSE